MLGGLARRVSHVMKVRAEQQPVLVVDSGDLFSPYPAALDAEKAQKKARLLGQAYRRMEVGAVNVGCLDLIQGLDLLRQEYSQGLPLVSANLLDPSTKTAIFPPYAIREAAELRVAFFGLLSPELGPEISPAVRRVNEGKILIGDPVKAAGEVVQKLKERADLFILLSDMGLARDQEVARAVPGIHFILGGHEGRFTGRAHRSEKTFILQSSAKGMNVGHLRLTLKNIGLPFMDAGESLYLQEKISFIDSRLQGLKATRESQSAKDTDLDRWIQNLNRQRSTLQEELKKSRQTIPQRNRFLFTTVPMEMTLPEDEEVKKRIAEMAIEKD